METLRRFPARKFLDEARLVRDESRLAHDNGIYEEVRQRIFQSLIDVDYSLESGTQTNGEAAMTYSKMEIDEAGQLLLANYIASLQRDEANTPSFTDPKNWLAVNQLEYAVGDVRLNIFSFLPSNFKVIFCPTSEIKTGSVLYEDKTIFISGDIATMGGIATILHEIGHVKDDEKLQALGETTLIEGGVWHESTEAEQLRKEREASLFALRKMWPILRRDSQLKSDIIMYLKNVAYFSYCVDSLQKVANAQAIIGHPGDYDHYTISDDEMEDQARYDAWERFKASAEYAAWKQLPEFHSLESVEEFGAWSEWIVSSGKIDDAAFSRTYFHIEAEPTEFDISELIQQILATANMPERLRLTKALEWQIADRSDVVATLDWTNLNHAKWIRSFVQRADVSGVWKIAIRATESQMKEDPNIFTGVIDWIQVSE